jgi:predicted ArsR family transcriptional regulator
MVLGTGGPDPAQAEATLVPRLQAYLSSAVQQLKTFSTASPDQIRAILGFLTNTDIAVSAYQPWGVWLAARGRPLLQQTVTTARADIRGALTQYQNLYETALKHLQELQGIHDKVNQDVQKSWQQMLQDTENRYAQITQSMLGTMEGG